MEDEVFLMDPHRNVYDVDRKAVLKKYAYSYRAEAYIARFSQIWNLRYKAALLLDFALYFNPGPSL